MFSSRKASASRSAKNIVATVADADTDHLTLEQVLKGIEAKGGKQARQVPRCRLARLVHKFSGGKERIDKEVLPQLLEYLERGHKVQEELNELAIALEAAEQQAHFYKKRFEQRERSTSNAMQLSQLKAMASAADDKRAEAERARAAAEKSAAAQVASAAAALARAERLAAGGEALDLSGVTLQDDAAPEPLPVVHEDSTVGSGQLWRVQTWLTSLPLISLVARALLKPLRAVVGGGAGDVARAEFEFARGLGEDDLAALLGAAKLGGLAPVIAAGLAQLHTQAAATGEELASKFAVSAKFELAFGGLDTFFAGLERMVGPPALIDGSLLKAMAFEHEAAPDATTPFSSSNGLTSTSHAEWEFVAKPKDGKKYAEREQLRPDWRRGAMRVDELKRRMAGRNEVLVAAGHTELCVEEVVGGRLYTGPMYEKYNAVLRAQSGTPFLAAKFERLCGDNNYRTTLHAINSCVIKLSKVQPVCKLYRGFTDGTLPDTFWRKDALGVAGGCEYAFMSTTTVRQQAVHYAAGQASTIFELHQGMVDRGADISWLSQYEHEAEVLMPPLCGLEVTGTRVEGQSLVVECQLSLNLNSLTLEAVVSKRRAIVADMCTNMQLELRQELRQKDAVRRASTSVAGLVAGRGSGAAEQEAPKGSKGWPDLRELCGDFDVDALATSMLDEQLVSIRSQDVEHYNDDKMLSRAVQAAVHAKAAVNGWPSIMEEVLAASLLDEVSDDENEGDEEEGDEEEGDDDGSDGDDDDDEDDDEEDDDDDDDDDDDEMDGFKKELKAQVARAEKKAGLAKAKTDEEKELRAKAAMMHAVRGRTLCRTPMPKSIGLEEKHGDSGCGALGLWMRCQGGARVTSLNICESELTACGFAHICAALQASGATPKELDFGANKIDDIAPLRSLATESGALCRLESFALSANPITDLSPLADAIRARALPKLKKLLIHEISGRPATLFPGLVPGACDELTIITLDELPPPQARHAACRVALALAHLHCLPHALCMPSTFEFAAVLESGALPALREIYLQKAKLGVEGTKAICAALGTGKVPELRCLCIDDNHMGDKVGGPALAECLGSLPKLVKLEATKNGLGSNTAKALTAVFERGGCSELKEVDLGDNSMGAAFTPLAKALARIAPGLEDLNLEGNDLTEEALIALANSLSRAKSLEKLDLSDCGFSGRAADALATAVVGMRSLTHLIMQKCKIKTADAVKIAQAVNQLDEIKELDMAGATFASREESRRQVLDACASKMAAGLKVSLEEEDDDDEDEKNY